MKYRQVVLNALFTLGVVSSVHAGDITAGKAKVIAICAECHGINGISVIANFPNLAGQKELYLLAQLKAFKEGRRKNLEMNLIVKKVSDLDIANVAAYFASLPCTPKGAKN